MGNNRTTAPQKDGSNKVWTQCCIFDKIICFKEIKKMKKWIPSFSWNDDFWSEKVISTDFFKKVKNWSEFYLWTYCFNNFGHSSVHWPRLIIEKLLAVLMDLGVKIEQNYPSSMWIPLHLNHEALPKVPPVWKYHSCGISSKTG